MSSGSERKEYKLRSGTRKDYDKMAGNQEEDERTSEMNSDGDIVDKEVFGNDSDDYDTEKSVDDDELQVVANEIEQMRIAEEKLKKKKEHKRLKEEADQMKKRLQKWKKEEERERNGRRKEQLVTSASLRKMDDVVKKVDDLMDEKLKVKSSSSKKSHAGESSTSSSSSSSSSSSELSSSSSSSDSEYQKSSSSSKKKKKGRKHKKSRSDKKHRSGKSKRLTSYVKYPEKWPHTYLSLHFVSKEKKFEELTIAEFAAGYSTILEQTSGESKRLDRIAHFKEIMYLATRYQWKYVLNYHAACLLEIERGHMKWGDSFQALQSTTLAGGFLLNSARGGNTGGGSGGSRSTRSTNNENGQVTFCKAYQRGNCSHTSDHQGLFLGENRLLKHICAKCWLAARKQETHSENSENCPLKDASS